jgi:hypothetical protein
LVKRELLFLTRNSWSYVFTDGGSIYLASFSACSFRWFIVAESTVRWFVREKHCWMAADSADPAKRTGYLFFFFTNAK